ncbi:hypothetical protein EVAR_62791_1 [Eumeta japonica]|uniref:Uncharacterized protein n=1 Tax=Eumeta variegata TaxID=151549 RepID=A0A4C1ZGM6_EUMVA|nr:hypothetical protein EVAR_62791_1 [Eumeta japonica]
MKKIIKASKRRKAEEAIWCDRVSSEIVKGDKVIDKNYMSPEKEVLPDKIGRFFRYKPKSIPIRPLSEKRPSARKKGSAAAGPIFRIITAFIGPWAARRSVNETDPSRPGKNLRGAFIKLIMLMGRFKSRGQFAWISRVSDVPGSVRGFG